MGKAMQYLNKTFSVSMYTPKGKSFLDLPERSKVNRDKPHAYQTGSLGMCLVCCLDRRATIHKQEDK